jgi:hypothetical protein
MPANCEARLYASAKMLISLMHLTWDNAFSVCTTYSCLGRVLCEVISIDILVICFYSEANYLYGNSAMTQSEAPKALQASVRIEQLDPKIANCWISAQNQTGKFAFSMLDARRFKNLTFPSL